MFRLRPARWLWLTFRTRACSRPLGDAGTAIQFIRLSYHTDHIEPRRIATSTQPPANPRRNFREAESYWRGGLGAVTETQTYGEVYDNSPGGSPIPTMNGRVSHYRTNTGSRLTRYTLSSP
jgi:hypothetical protein